MIRIFFIKKFLLTLLTTDKIGNLKVREKMPNCIKLDLINLR